ncbi:pilus assembly PilX N-terminal domain-containing protein [Metasolibacillus fluoroglycofenilyticus]|uniref:pilus assembly PilX N-terminal domain-containing protein n=1 Tax=Metasolibacillus fluoroglycofenilyticus TaxID=1239396 RepID=UPI000D3AA97C|nr:pilus assembly PilX N-terminal domain-containing protein [Metasolibacillus fluoroglycofenilyticus]
MNKQLNNQRGSALVIALFLIVIISILGVSLLSVSSNSLKQVDYERTDQAVFYIAEAGINLAKEEVKLKLRTIEDLAINDITLWIEAENTRRKTEKLPKLTKQLAMDQYLIYLKNRFDEADFSDISFTISSGKVAFIELQPSSTEFKVKIISTGSINGAKERIVDQEIRLRPSLYASFEDGDEDKEETNNPLPPSPIPGGWENHTVLTSGDIVFNSSGEIHGDTALKNGNIIFNNYSGKILTENGSAAGNVNMDSTKQSIIPVSQAQTNAWFYPKNIAPPLAIDPKSFLSSAFLDGISDRATDLSKITPLQKYTVVKNNNNIDLVANGILSTQDSQPYGWLRDNVTFKITEDTYLKAIKIYSNRTITIDVGDNDVNLLVDDFDMNYGTINVIGNGKLNLYVKKFTALNSTTGFNANTKNPSKVDFNYIGTDKFILNGATPFYASLINYTADMSLGSGSKVFGNIISGGRNITFSGSTPTTGQHVIAPNANLIIDGSASIKGTVVADSINFTGNGRIYKGSNLPPLPPGVGPSDEFEDLPNPDGERLPLEEGSMTEN